MDPHVAHLAASGIARSAKQVGDRAPAIQLRDQHGKNSTWQTCWRKGR